MIAGAGIGLLASRSLSRVSGATAAVYERGLRPVRGILMLRGQVAESRALLNALLSEPVEAKQKELHGQIARWGAQADATLTELLALGQWQDDEQARLAEIRTEWQKYQEIREKKVVPFVSDGDADSARAVARGPLNASYVTLCDQIVGLMEMFDGRARGTVTMAEQSAGTARHQLVFSGLLTLGLVAALIMMISRSICRPIGQVANILAENVGKATKASRVFQDSSQALAEGASEQAASIEEISASLEEMAGRTSENFAHAKEANKFAHETHAAAERGAEGMKQMGEAMNAIQASGDDIAKIRAVPQLRLN